MPAIFFVGQMLADYVLAPYLVGRRVNLNPVWLLFALFAFGYLFGFVGLLIAVPLAAAIGVLVRFALAALSTRARSMRPRRRRRCRRRCIAAFRQGAGLTWQAAART